MSDFPSNSLSNALPDPLVLTPSDFIHHLKLSLQMPTLIAAIAAQRILAATAAVEGIQIDLAELQRRADSLRRDYQLLSAEDTWTWLQRHQLSLEEFEQLVYESVMASQLAQHLFADRVEAYFADHRLDYTQVALYDVILDDMDVALELFYGLQANEISFADVAAHYATDPALRRSGGYRGLVHRSDLHPELAAAVFAVQPPQLLRPIVVEGGIYLIYVAEMIEPLLDEARRAEIQAYLFQTWLQQRILTTRVQVDLT
jgi:parvulin-like peptidyl-prolyl isomerase